VAVEAEEVQHERDFARLPKVVENYRVTVIRTSRVSRGSSAPGREWLIALISVVQRNAARAWERMGVPSVYPAMRISSISYV
jgi:hypothetical protein